MKVCSDTCNHCMYIGEGDFLCDLTHKMTIEDWIPKECVFFKVIKTEKGKVTRLE